MTNWIQLTSGGGYDFDDKLIFGPFKVDADLAWPLTCPRWTRHTPRFSWPVTLHSVACARVIEKITGDAKAAAAGLLHDAHEAVIGDITTPVARHIDAERVSELKHDVDIAIFTKLDIDFDLLPSRHRHYVQLADAAALQIERRLFTAPEPRAWNATLPEHHWMRAMYEEITDLVRRMRLFQAIDPVAIPDDGMALFLDEYYRLVTAR